MFNKALEDEISKSELFEVLESQTTLETVRGLLREKDLPHSASSWEKWSKAGSFLRSMTALFK